MYKIGCIYLVLLFGISCFSQSSDFRTWWAGELEGKLFKNAKYEISPELRLIDNSTQPAIYLIDTDVSYRPMKYVGFGGLYRIAKMQLKDEHLINRFGAYIKLRYKLGEFRFAYRALYHWEYVGLNTREEGNIPNQYHRHRVSLKFYKKKWDIRPSASVEYFVHRRPVDRLYEQKFRLSLGAGYAISNKVSLYFGYKYQEEFFVNSPLTSHIFVSKVLFKI